MKKPFGKKPTRLLALLCCFVMLFCLLPINAFAAGCTVNVTYAFLAGDPYTYLYEKAPEKFVLKQGTNPNIGGDEFKIPTLDQYGYTLSMASVNGVFTMTNETAIKNAAEVQSNHWSQTIEVFLVYNCLFYQVTFDASGGTFPQIGNASEYVVNLSPVPAAGPNPTLYQPAYSVEKAGAMFTGWYKDAACTQTQKWVFGTDEVKGPMTLYAGWEDSTWNVKYIDGLRETETDESVPNNTTFMPADPDSYPGYTFDGWYQGTTKWKNTDLVTEDITLVAKWIPDTPLTFPVILYTPGVFYTPGVSTMTVDVLQNEPMTDPGDVDKPNHTFEGWYKDGVRWNFSDNVTGPMLLIAQWSFETYTVTFDPGGGSPTPATQFVQDGNQASRPYPDPSKVGENFQGWYLGGALYNFNDPVAVNITLEAKYEREKYTIIFNGNGGTPASTTEYAYYNDPLPTPPEVLRDEYTWDNYWYKDSACIYAWNMAEDKVTSNLTLYAKWIRNTPPVATYTVTFNSLGGTPVDDRYDPQIVDSGQKAKEPPPIEKDNCVLVGWCWDAACTIPFDFSHPITSNMTLYAKWEQIKYDINIKFTVNQPYPYSGPALDPLYPEVNDRYYVNDPYTAPMVWGGTDKIGDYIWELVIVNGQPYSPKNFTDVSAPFYLSTGTDIWKKDLKIEYFFSVEEFTVTFDPNGGEFWNGNWSDPANPYTDPFPWTVAPGTPVTDPESIFYDYNANMHRPGYTFSGWKDDAGNTWIFTDPVLKTLNLTASWTALPQNVTFDFCDGVTPPETIQVYCDDVIPSAAIPKPTRTGYEFIGWQYDTGTGPDWVWDGSAWVWMPVIYAPFDFSWTVPNGGLTLYAGWKILEYQLMFKDSLSSEIYWGPNDVAYDTPCSWTATKPGYSFNSWYDEDRSTYWPTSFNMPAHYLTLTALWDKLELTDVVFPQADAIGGSVGDFIATVENATSPVSVNLNAIEFQVSNVKPENHLWVRIYKNDVLYGVSVRDVTLNSNGNYIFNPAIGSMPGLVNGDVITYVVYDGAFDYVEVGRFTVTVKVPIKLLSIEGFSVEGVNFNKGILSPAVDHPSITDYTLIPNNPAYRTTYGIYITHTKVSNELLTAYATTEDGTTHLIGYPIEPDPALSDAGVSVFKHAPLDLNDGPVLYTIMNGSEVLAKITVKPRFVVEFDVLYNGGRWDSKPVNQEPVHGEKIFDPANASYALKTGHTFYKWWYDNNGTWEVWDFGDQVTSDMILYASWEPNPVTVTFKTVGGYFDPSHPQNPNLEPTDEITIEIPYGTTVPAGDVPVPYGGVNYKFVGWDCFGVGPWDPTTDPVVYEPGITLTAQWEEIFYTVTFVDHDDRFIYEYTGQPYNTTIPDPNGVYFLNPTLPGFQFNGWWYQDPNNYNEWTRWVFGVGGTQLTGDITLKAGYLERFTVNFVDDGAPVPGVSPQTILDGDTASEPYKPWLDGLKTHYTFNVWWFDPVGNGDPNDFVIWDFDDPITSNMTLVASWTPNEYKVNFFDAHGGPGGLPLVGPQFAEQIIAYGVTNGGKVLEPTPEPEKEGWTFNGEWYYHDGSVWCLWDLNDLVESDLNLHAQWTKNEYTVTFNSNYTGGPEKVGTLNHFDNYGDIMSIQPNLAVVPWTRTGYTFDYWYYIENGNPVQLTAPYTLTGPLTLYAQWKIKTHSVYFNRNNPPSTPWNIEGVPGDLYNVEYGSTLAFPGAPSKPNFRFTGWYRDAACTIPWAFENTDGIPPDTLGDTDLTLFAGWVRVWTVTYTAVGSTDGEAPVDSGKYAVGELVTVLGPNTLVCTGRTLVGWKDTFTNIVYGFYDKFPMYNAPVELEPVWESIAYKVTFELGNDAASFPAGVDNPVWVYFGTTVARPAAPSWDGHLFINWYKDPACTTQWNFAGDYMPAHDVTIYAKWTEVYIVTLDYQIDDPDGPWVSQSVEDGKSIVWTGLEPVRTGYTFKGWYDYFDNSLWSTLWYDTIPITEDINLYALWEPKPYTVSFRPTGMTGATLADDTPLPYTLSDVPFDSTVDFPGIAKLDGYRFTGWYKDYACTEAWDFVNDVVKGDTNIYAGWVKTWKVTFDFYGGEDVSGDTSKTIILDDGEKIPGYEIPTGLKLDGYEIPTGEWWHYTINWGTPNWSDWGNMAYWNFDTPVVGDLVLIPDWKINYYTVSFDLDGGEPRSPSVLINFADQTVAHGGTASWPGYLDDPNGVYDFTGWFIKGTTTEWNFGDPVEKPLELIAGWELKEFTVTFWNRLGTSWPSYTGPYAFTVNYGWAMSGMGYNLPSPNPERTDHIFGGWLLWPSMAPFDETTLVYGDITVVPQWNFIVTYKANGGVGPDRVDDNYGDGYAPGSTFTVLTNGDTGYTYTGQRFDDWNTWPPGPAYYAGATYTINSNLTLYANWASEYSVTYRSNNGLGDEVVDSGFVSGQPVTLRDIGTWKRTGYHFLGWDTAWNATTPTYGAYDIYIMGSGLTLYAIWEIDTYTVKFDSNGGTPVSLSDVPCNYNASLGSLLPTVTRGGYRFGGWYDVTPPPMEYTATTPITGDVTLVAQWIRVYTVRYVASDGTTAAWTDTVEYEEDNFTIRDITAWPFASWGEPGYHFTGWNTQSDGLGAPVAVGTNQPGNADKEIYAMWDKDFTVTYDENNGTATPKTHQVATYFKPTDTYLVENYNHAALLFEKTDFVFDSWNTAWDGFGTKYMPGETIPSFSGNVTLYAQWVPRVDKITYIGNGGSGTMADAFWNAGQWVTLDQNMFTRVGYDFVCWNTVWNGWTTGDTYEDQDSFTMAGDLSLYAQWGRRVTFLSEGGTFATIAVPDGGRISDYYNIATLIPTHSLGYEFDGWCIEGIGTSWGLTVDPVTGPLRLEAKWKPTLSSFIGNEIFASLDSSTPVTVSVTGTAPDFELTVTGVTTMTIGEFTINVPNMSPSDNVEIGATGAVTALPPWSYLTNNGDGTFTFDYNTYHISATGNGKILFYVGLELVGTLTIIFA